VKLANLAGQRNAERQLKYIGGLAVEPALPALDFALVGLQHFREPPARPRRRS